MPPTQYYVAHCKRSVSTSYIHVSRIEFQHDKGFFSQKNFVMLKFYSVHVDAITIDPTHAGLTSTPSPGDDIKLEKFFSLLFFSG